MVVTRAMFSLSGKTTFGKEILKMWLRVKNVLLEILCTTLADISSFPKLLLDFRLVNAFFSSKSIRLMVLR